MVRRLSGSRWSEEVEILNLRWFKSRGLNGDRQAVVVKGSDRKAREATGKVLPGVNNRGSRWKPWLTAKGWAVEELGLVGFGVLEESGFRLRMKSSSQTLQMS